MGAMIRGIRGRKDGMECSHGEELVAQRNSV